MRIIGIDPGTLNAGFGIIVSDGMGMRRVAGGCVRAASGMSLPERLVKVYQGLRDAIGLHGPVEAAIETVFAGDNIKTAIAIGEARGVALLAAAEAGLAVTGYEPATIKRAVAGSGRADKEQIRRMVQVLLGLDEPPATDHEADALAMAITHAMRRRMASPDDTASAARRAAVSGMARRELPDHVLAQLPPGMAPARGRRRRK